MTEAMLNQMLTALELMLRSCRNTLLSILLLCAVGVLALWLLSKESPAFYSVGEDRVGPLSRELGVDPELVINLQEARVTRNNQIFLIRRYRHELGSGDYTYYQVAKVENSQIHKIGEYTTCGRMKLESDRLIFFKPHDFHCGIISGPIGSLFAQTETLELK